MKIIDGQLFVDDRGSLSCVNGFDFKDVKRFYMVKNHTKGFIRAWHGHKKEGKYVSVVSGAAIVAYTSIENPGFMYKLVLSASKPQILFIPPGNYNGFKTLTNDTKLIFYSTSTLEESMSDDIRESADKWRHVWRIKER